MAVPLIDITRQLVPIRDEIDQAISRVLDHCKYILGPEVRQFEEEIEKFTGAKHAIGVASGTDALLISLRAMGVGPGDEVITSSFSFFASAGVISHLKAKPVFVDIDRNTFNINPNLIEQAVTPKSKVILPVHLFGQCAEMKPILDIAAKHDLKVLEDGAQAIGSSYKGRPAGTIGDAGTFSFFPTKNLGCAGDGGMIVTDNDELAEQARILRVHGGRFEYHHKYVGYNSRLDTIQAALLLAKLPHLSAWTEARRNNAAAYDTAFKDLPVITPDARAENYHIYNQYTIAVDNREGLLKEFEKRQIGYKIYYPVPFHMQECFDNLNYKTGQFPISEWAAGTVVSLPIFGEMTETEQGEVIATVRKFYS